MEKMRSVRSTTARRCPGDRRPGVFLITRGVAWRGSEDCARQERQALTVATQVRVWSSLTKSEVNNRSVLLNSLFKSFSLTAGPNESYRAQPLIVKSRFQLVKRSARALFHFSGTFYRLESNAQNTCDSPF